MVYFHPTIDQEAIEKLGIAERYEYEYKYFFETWTDGLENTVIDWFEETYMLPYVLSAIYVAFIVFGTQFMKGRSPFDLRMPLAVWSGVLAIFSILGAARTLPELIYTIRQYSFHHSVCHPGFYYGVPGFWSIMFVLSKPYELGDTIFIVLRKQKLIFLHWYHHITVMIYVWVSYPPHSSAGRWFYVMNYTVHAFMYTYYTLRALRYRIPRWVQVGITSMQIAQMVIGLLVLTYVGLVSYTGRFCQMSFNLSVLGTLMYLSYFVLFSYFFYNSYMTKRSQQDRGKDEKSKYDSDPSLKKDGESNINFGLPSGEELNHALRSVAEIGRSGYTKKNR